MYQHSIPDYPVMEVVSKYGLGYSTNIQPIGYATAHFLMCSARHNHSSKRGV